MLVFMIGVSNNQKIKKTALVKDYISTKLAGAVIGIVFPKRFEWVHLKEEKYKGQTHQGA